MVNLLKFIFRDLGTENKAIAMIVIVAGIVKQNLSMQVSCFSVG